MDKTGRPLKEWFYDVCGVAALLVFIVISFRIGGFQALTASGLGLALGVIILVAGSTLEKRRSKQSTKKEGV